jgi:hypothetical protein
MFFYVSFKRFKFLLIRGKQSVPVQIISVKKEALRITAPFYPLQKGRIAQGVLLP